MRKTVFVDIVVGLFVADAVVVAEVVAADWQQSQHTHNPAVQLSVSITLFQRHADTSQATHVRTVCALGSKVLNRVARARLALPVPCTSGWWLRELAVCTTPRPGADVP